MKKLFVVLLLAAPALSFSADKEKVSGLVCDMDAGAQETKVKIEIKVKGDDATLSFRNAFELRGMGRMLVSKRAIEPILEQKLQKMNNVTLDDRDAKAVISFRVDGAQFDGTPRLGIKLKLDGEDYRLSSCNVEIDRPYHL